VLINSASIRNSIQFGYWDWFGDFHT
jgi:hypothetical protein